MNEKQKEQARLRKQKQRDILRNNSVTLDSVTYHPILDALVDPVKRDKLERISQELKNHHVSELVSYGCRKPIPFDVVGDLLEATA